jgi:hypothetical protein
VGVTVNALDISRPGRAPASRTWYRTSQVWSCSESYRTMDKLDSHPERSETEVVVTTANPSKGGDAKPPV